MGRGYGYVIPPQVQTIAITSLEPDRETLAPCTALGHRRMTFLPVHVNYVEARLRLLSRGGGDRDWLLPLY